LTADDSLVEELVRRGHLSEEEAQGHPQRNLLLRALGVTGTVEVGVQEEILQAGDVLLLCSDGLTNMVSDREIADLVDAAGTLEEAAEKLITAANERGGYDNITVVLVRCPEGEAGEQGSKGAGEQGRMVNGEWLMANGQPSAISHQPSTRGRLTDSSLIPHPSSLARRKTWRPLLKVLAGVGLVAALLWGGWRLGQAYLARQYFLSAANGQVVLYQGLPRQLMGRPLYHPYQLMKEPVGRVMERYRESLQRGIVVASPEEATKRLQEILEPHAENGTASGSL
jgi:protein phosphatase